MNDCNTIVVQPPRMIASSRVIQMHDYRTMFLHTRGNM